MSWDDVTSSGPDLIVVAPCGFRLAGASGPGRGLVAGAGCRPASRYGPSTPTPPSSAPGPRLVDGVETLAAIIHPGAAPIDPSLATPI